MDTSRAVMLMSKEQQVKEMYDIEHRIHNVKLAWHSVASTAQWEPGT